MACAAKNSCLDVMEWLNGKGCEMDEMSYRKAIKHDAENTVFEWLESHGLDHDLEIYDEASKRVRRWFKIRGSKMVFAANEDADGDNESDD
jgi:hypothetical protein